MSASNYFGIIHMRKDGCLSVVQRPIFEPLRTEQVEGVVQVFYGPHAEVYQASKKFVSEEEGNKLECLTETEIHERLGEIMGEKFVTLEESMKRLTKACQENPPEIRTDWYCFISQGENGFGHHYKRNTENIPSHIVKILKGDLPDLRVEAQEFIDNHPGIKLARLQSFQIQSILEKLANE